MGSAARRLFVGWIRGPREPRPRNRHRRPAWSALRGHGGERLGGVGLGCLRGAATTWRCGPTETARKRSSNCRSRWSKRTSWRPRVRCSRQMTCAASSSKRCSLATSPHFERSGRRRARRASVSRPASHSFQHSIPRRVKSSTMGRSFFRLRSQRPVGARPDDGVRIGWLGHRVCEPRLDGLTVVVDQPGGGVDTSVGRVDPAPQACDSRFVDQRPAVASLFRFVIDAGVEASTSSVKSSPNPPNSAIATPPNSTVQEIGVRAVSLIVS